MAQTEAKKLDAGEPFPNIHLSLINGTSLDFPREAHDRWSVFLTYRGHW